MADTLKFSIDVPRAYLDMSRAFLNCAVKHPDGAKYADTHSFTTNTAFAMGVHGYIYAYAAIVAFATEQFSKMWNNPNSKFRRKYNKAPNLNVLLRNELAELKDALKDLSEIKGIKHLHVADPALWDDLLQVVRVARNFYLHPKPDPEEFSHIVGLTHTKKTFSYPSDVASKVISYYISSMGFVVPDWVYNSTEFRIQSVEAIKLQEKL